MDCLITREGVRLELEDRELLETAVPARLAEVLWLFAEAQRLGRRRNKLPHGFSCLRDLDKAAQYQREYHQEEYARRRKDPARWVAWLEHQREYLAERRLDPDKRANEVEARRRSYAKLRSDPVRYREYVEKNRQRQRRARAAREAST